jgi:hypothetical protein
MPLRYLFGPVPARFAEQCLWPQRLPPDHAETRPCRAILLGQEGRNA